MSGVGTVEDQRRGTRCALHNADVAPPSAYLLTTLPAQNMIGVCAPCAAWWRAEEPDSIESIRSAAP